MLLENKKMQDYLKNNGVKATPKYLRIGSLKGCWRLYDLKTKWYGNNELIDKMDSLGFTDFDGKGLTHFSGNGGVFHIFARHHKTNEFIAKEY